MGTQGSSDGPGGGVPFDPPWLDDIAPPEPGDGPQPDSEGPDDGDSGDGQPTPLPQAPVKTPDVAPPARFRNARRALRDFVRTGNQDAFRRAVGHYSRTGMDGARGAASRMRTSAQSGADVFNILQSARERTNPTVNEWVDSLTARNASAQEIAEEIIRHAAPSGGSQDEAACQESMAQAMGDLLTNTPSIDLLNLDDDRIWSLIESFLSYEAFHRLCLDIGQVFEDTTFSPRDRVMRMNEMQDYLKAELRAQVEELRAKTPNPGSGQLRSILQSALQHTFAVYEGSI